MAADDLVIPGPREDPARAKLSLDRRLPGPVHYVLSGGGSHGAVQWGALQALAETDVEPDQVIGTSAGALNGGIVAEDPRSANTRLAFVWGQLTERNLVGQGSVARSVLTHARSSSLFSANSERSAIEQIFTARDFSDLQLTFAAVATDLETGRAQVFDSGDLVAALLATSAIPGILPPVQIDGRWYCDGLASANLPATVAVHRGAGSIVVLDTGSRTAAEVSRSPTVVAQLAANALRINQRSRQLASAAKSVPVIVLPSPNDLGSTMDFADTMPTAARAYEQTREYLTELSRGRGRLQPGLYEPYIEVDDEQ